MFATYISLVNFDDTGKLRAKLRVFLHSEADAMGHVPSGFIGNRKLPLKLFRGDALLRGANHVDRQEPLGEGQMGVVEDGPHGYGELISALKASVEVPHLPA